MPGKQGRSKRNNNNRMPTKVDIGKEVKMDEIDYKNTSLLKKFVNSRQKILPQKSTGLSAKKHRKLRTEIKKARVMALMSFTDRHALS